MRQARLWWAIVAKDLRLELRSGGRMAATAAFVALAGFLFSFVLDRGRVAGRDVAAPFTWLTILFAATASSGRVFDAEEEEGAFRHLLLSPVSRPAIFLGKTAATFAAVWIAAALSFAALTAFLGVREPGSLWAHVAVLLPGAIGLAAVGTFFGRISTHSALGDAVIPALTFPLLAPLVFFGVTASSRIFQGIHWSEVAGPVRMLWAYALGALGVGSLLFHYVVDE